MKLDPRGPRLCRPCIRCGNSFQPSGKFQRVCDRCAARGYYVPTAKKLRLMRPCCKCNNPFRPTGSHSKICEACLEISKRTQIQKINEAIKNKRELKNGI